MKTLHLGGVEFMKGRPTPSTVQWRVVVWSGRYETKQPTDLIEAIQDAVEMLVADGVTREAINLSLDATAEQDYGDYIANCEVAVTGQREATEAEVVVERDRLQQAHTARKQAEIARLKQSLAALERNR